MTIAPLHPTHPTEPEPIFWQTMLDHNRDRIVVDVTAGLDWSEPKLRVVVCPTCQATKGRECRTSSGRKTKWHAGRRTK